MARQNYLELVEGFHYLGDQVSNGRNCSESIASSIRNKLGKFQRASTYADNKGLSFIVKGSLIEDCYEHLWYIGKEAWSVTIEDLQRLERNEPSTCHLMSNVSMSMRKSESDKQRKSEHTEHILSIPMQCWYGHVICIDEDSYIKKCDYITDSC